MKKTYKQQEKGPLGEGYYLHSRLSAKTMANIPSQQVVQRTRVLFIECRLQLKWHLKVLTSHFVSSSMKTISMSTYHFWVNKKSLVITFQDFVAKKITNISSISRSPIASFFFFFQKTLFQDSGDPMYFPPVINLKSSLNSKQRN